MDLNNGKKRMNKNLKKLNLTTLVTKVAQKLLKKKLKLIIMLKQQTSNQPQHPKSIKVNLRKTKKDLMVRLIKFEVHKFTKK